MAKRRSSRLPAGVKQLYLFPGDVALKPRRQSTQAPRRPACVEVGHSWQVGTQARLFGLPPEEIMYCAHCGVVRRP